MPLRSLLEIHINKTTQNARKQTRRAPVSKSATHDTTGGVHTRRARHGGASQQTEKKLTRGVHHRKTHRGTRGGRSVQARKQASNQPKRPRRRSRKPKTNSSPTGGPHGNRAVLVPVPLPLPVDPRVTVQGFGRPRMTNSHSCSLPLYARPKSPATGSSSSSSEDENEDASIQVSESLSPGASSEPDDTDDREYIIVDELPPDPEMEADQPNGELVSPSTPYPPHTRQIVCTPVALVVPGHESADSPELDIDGYMELFQLIKKQLAGGAWSDAENQKLLFTSKCGDSHMYMDLNSCVMSFGGADRQFLRDSVVDIMFLLHRIELGRAHPARYGRCLLSY